MKSFILCVLALFVVSPIVSAQPRGASVVAQCNGGYVWTKILNASGEEELILWCNGFQVGNYRLKDGQFWGYVDGHSWRKDVSLPIALPRGYGVKNFGMQWTPRDRDENVLHFGGGSKPDVKKIIKKTADADEVPNYNGMWSLTAVSADAEKRKRVADDLTTHPALGRWRSERIKEYAPDNWALRPMKCDEDESFAKAGVMLLVSPPCDANFKAPIEVIYGYAGAEDTATRLREIESKYNPNVHAHGRHAGMPVWKVCLLVVGVAFIGIVVLAFIGGAICVLVSRR